MTDSSPPNFDEITAGIAGQGLAALQEVLGESWFALSIKERGDCLHLMVTLAKARIYELVGRDVSHFLPILNAAFLNWKVVGKQVVSNAIKDVATQMFGFAGAFAGGVLSAFLKSVI